MLPKSITKFAKLLLIFAPPLLIGILIFMNGVDVPVLDEWDGTAPLFEKMADGSLGFGDFYTQHNEHRIFFPRLIFFALGRLTHWDIRAELWVIFLLTLVCLLNIWQIARRGAASQKRRLVTLSPDLLPMGEPTTLQRSSENNSSSPSLSRWERRLQFCQSGSDHRGIGRKLWETFKLLLTHFGSYSRPASFFSIRRTLRTFFGDFRLDSCSPSPVSPHAFGRRHTCAIHSIS